MHLLKILIEALMNLGYKHMHPTILNSSTAPGL